MKKDRYGTEQPDEYFVLDKMWETWTGTDQEVNDLFLAFAAVQNELICLERELDPLQQIIPGKDWDRLSETIENIWKLVELSENCPADKMMQNKPHTERGKNTAEVYAKNRKLKDDARHEEWEKYPTYLNGYFVRNPKHKLTDARRACAKEFSMSLKTIERRTKGYKKPPIKNCGQAK